MKPTKCLGVACLLLPSLLFGQEFRATISGHVYDPTNAAVPGANIQAVNVATNETATAVTDASGAYTIPFLRPGQYRLTVTAQGFKQFIRENITLEVGRIAGIDVTLEVGEVTESVSVTAEAALLETQTASRGGVVNTVQVAELPLNSRNPFMLGSMMAGVTFRGAAIWQRPFDNGAIAEWSVNGGRQSNNEFLLDGAPNNAQAGGNNIAYVPIVDAVQEFNVQSNSYDAQYGHTGGGIFNVILKSGTQELHGAAWEFYRTKALDANTFQNNAIGEERPDHKLHQYGVQLGGPLYFPKLLKKDSNVKAFFLGSFENYYEEWPQFLRNSFPEPEMREGDFSKLTTADGRPIIIYNPFTSRFDANGDPIREPFPNNRIPESMIHPVAREVTKYMPMPNAKTPGQRYSMQNLLNPEYAATDDFYNLILKFDWNFGDKHRAFIRHASNDRTEDRCINGICEGPGMDGQQPFQRINDAYVLDWVGSLSPTLVVNVRGAYNRFIEKGFGRGNENFDLTSLGLPSSLISQLPGPTYFGRWEFQNGYAPLGRYQSINITNNYALMGNVTKVAGSHTVKMGVDIRRIHYIQQNSGNILYFQGQTRWTQRLYNQEEDTSGDGYASFLLGIVNASSNYPLYPFTRQWYIAPYIQDDWKVTRKLTLNLGLRWDYNGPPDEKWNRMNRGFDRNAASPVASQIPAEMLAQYPQLKDLKGGLRFTGVDGQPRIAADRDLNNFQPRIGAAYQLTSKLVLRAGYGLYYLNPNNDYLKFAGFSTSTPSVYSIDGNRTPIVNLGNPFPDGINVPPGASRGLLTYVGQNTSWFNPSFVTPKLHSFSVGWQYQLTQAATVEASYVGTRTVDANNEKAFNIPSAEFRKSCNLLEGGDPVYCNQALPNPFRNVPAFQGTSFYTAATLSRYQLARPFPQFSGDMTEQGRNGSRFWYNSLQVNYNHRFGRGLTFLANYSLSKTVESWGYADPFNDVEQRGLYFNDRPHWFKATAVYDLPFGRNQRFGSGTTGVVSKLISGWEITGFFNWASGEPNNLPGNVIQLKDPRTIGGRWTGKVDWKAHQVVGWNNCVLRQFNDGRIEPMAYSLASGCGEDFSNYAWLMVADYSPGGGSTPSNSRMTPFRSGQIRKQPMLTFDASLNKTTTITERFRLQLGLEAFNVLNHYYYGRDNHFNTTPTDSNFGTQFPSQAWIGNGYPRQVQVRMKLIW
ncbi:MAG TPA: TonB-dependent receptor [Bryobacteraceae bacterium]|nr:TonB-dependent receptor [Bryobacteraceae bacterium]